MTDDASFEDGYTAPAASIPVREAEDGERSRTLGQCFRAFSTRVSARVLAVLVVATVAVRIYVGDFSWRDLVSVALLLGSAPFIEWLIHVFVLHARPRKLLGLTLEMPNAKEHRVHHEAPSVLDWVLIPTKLLPFHLTMLGLLAMAFAFGVQLAFGGAWLPVALSTMVVSYGFLLTYEWTHFLMHSPYRPRSRYYRHIWKNHRLHHYKNEHYWFGVTSVVADTALHTAPDQKSVEKSPTARSLHGGV